MPEFMLDFAEISDAGGREANEDYCNSLQKKEEDVYCFVTADGLGGHRAGQMASRLAVESILEYLSETDFRRPEVSLVEAIQNANQVVYSAGRSDPELKGMRTTCAVALVIAGHLFMATVGDTRIYVFREGLNIFKSRDDSVVQMLVDLGEISPDEVRGHPDRNKVLKTLGDEEDPRPEEPSPIKLQTEDVILLCTDGLWEYINGYEIGEALRTARNASSRLPPADSMLKRMLLFARERAELQSDTYDNMTAQLVVVR